jgi:hypothetical protein
MPKIEDKWQQMTENEYKDKLRYVYENWERL